MSCSDKHNPPRRHSEADEPNHPTHDHQNHLNKAREDTKHHGSEQIDTTHPHTRRHDNDEKCENQQNSPHTPPHTTKTRKPRQRTKIEKRDENTKKARKRPTTNEKRDEKTTRARNERTSERGRANEDEGRRWWGVIPPPTPPSAAHSPQCSVRSRAPIVIPSTRCIGGYSTPKPPGPRGAFPFASPLVTTAPLTVRRSPPHYMLTRYPHSLRFIHFIHYMSVGSLPPPQPRHFVCFAPRRGYRVQRHPTTSAAHNCFGRAG